jgi:hypothetical protein
MLIREFFFDSDTTLFGDPVIMYFYIDDISLRVRLVSLQNLHKRDRRRLDRPSFVSSSQTQVTNFMLNHILINAVHDS